MFNPPKNAHLNLQFRKHVLKLGYADPKFARAIRAECATDPLLFFNAFAWILESRDAASWQLTRKYGDAKTIPFITRPYQDQVIKDSVPMLGKEDILLVKSKELGMSYTYVALAAWDVLFHEQTHIGLVSKDLLSADNPDDPDSLLSKIRFIVDRLPCWLLPYDSPKFDINFDRNVNQHSFKVLGTGSSLMAYAAMGDIARGGRKRWILFDEFHFFNAGDDQSAIEATPDVCNCRVAISTVNRRRGRSGAFYDLVTNPNHNGKVFTVNWQQDDEKMIGAYHSERIAGSESFKLVLDDTKLWKKQQNEDGTYRDPTRPDHNYKFVLDGLQRSLYFDHRARRPGVNARSLAAELGCDFGGATSQLIDAATLEDALLKVRPAVSHGELCRDPNDPNNWVLATGMATGSVTLWMDLPNGAPPPDRFYSAGVDVSAGTGGAYSSYSCLIIFDKESGEQVFEWRNNRMPPIEFASLCVWVCRLFNDAYMVPEINGPLGQQFIQRVIAEKYTSNVYRRRLIDRRNAQKTERLGYHNPDKGEGLLRNMENGLQRGAAHVNSSLALKEMGLYFYNRDGKISHSSVLSEEDQSGRGLAHGDAAIALGAAWLGCEDQPAPSKAIVEEKPLVNCFAARRAAWIKREKMRTQKKYWMPTY
jgi:hypothetical protein